MEANLERQEWLEARQRGLGGSDSPVVCGVSPFKKPSQLWAEKRGLVPLDQAPTPAMQRGTAMEPIIADLYAEKTGRELILGPQILQMDGFPVIQASIDRAIEPVMPGQGPGVLEIKCPGLKIFGKCLRDGLPPYYMVQLQHYLMVTGCQWGSFAVFNAERWRLIHFDVEVNDELCEQILEADLRFWDQVESGICPVDADQQIDMPKTEPSEVVQVDGSMWANAIDRLREARSLKEEADELEKNARADIKFLMEERGAGIVEGCGARIYWREGTGRTTLDTAALKAQCPDVYKKYAKTSAPVKSFRPYFFKEVE